MSNIYDTANQLEQEIRNSAEYKAIAEILAEVDANPETKATYNEFVSFQQELQEKMSKGEQLSQDDQTKIEAFQTKLQANELLTSLMAKEQALQIVINDIQQIVLKPVHDLYQARG